MAVSANKRSTMALYSGTSCPHSHKVRIALAEKGVTADIIDVNLDKKPEELLSMNPYGSVPTIVDRDLILYESNIILEYLDERFPHPPLMPVYPVARAKLRLMMHRIEKDWYPLLRIIQGDDEKAADAARKYLQESLISLTPLFESQNYFINDEFTLVDCCLAPLLWRLPLLKIDLAGKAKAIKAYKDRVFARPAFQASLSEQEQEMR